jgi:site-specific DNA-cytosine methylase
MKILELFSGTASFSKIARERGHKTFTIDFDKQFNPDLCIDILDFDISMLPEEFKHPDFIWASPPCQTFSVASIYRYWENGKPKNEKALRGLEIVKKTIKIIEELKPKHYIIENPRGMLRKQDFIQHLHRDTVTYCQYGHTVQKPTDLWNNLNHSFRPMCKPGSSCHEKASRSSRNGIQGINNSFSNLGSHGRVLRAVIPKQLCLEILQRIEKNIANNH